MEWKTSGALYLHCHLGITSLLLPRLFHSRISLLIFIVVTITLFCSFSDFVSKPFKIYLVQNSSSTASNSFKNNDNICCMLEEHWAKSISSKTILKLFQKLKLSDILSCDLKQQLFDLVFFHDVLSIVHPFPLHSSFSIEKLTLHNKELSTSSTVRNRIWSKN